MRKRTAILTISLMILGFGFLPFQSAKAQSALLELLPKQNRGVKKIPQAVMNSKMLGAVYERRGLFSPDVELITDGDALRSAVSEGVLLDLDKAAIKLLLKDRPQYLSLPVPDGKGGMIELELFRVNIFSEGFKAETSAPTSEKYEKGLGLHYRGMIKNEPVSLAAISIFENEVMGSVFSKTLGNSVLGRLQGNNPSDRHIFYEEKNLKTRLGNFCQVKDSNSNPVSSPAFQNQPDAADARVIRIYVEANYDLFQNKGSVAATNAYVVGVFNQSAVLFANDGINVSVSGIKVWNSPSPYTDALNPLQKLNLFGDNLQTTFNGDLAHLMFLSEFGTGVAWINVLCNRALSYGVSGILPEFQNVPTYSRTIKVFTHEVGHNLGSPHTHACVWGNDGNSAIDGCEAPVGCTNPGIPSEGGTIMSYCDAQPPNGVIFALGFGPQPKARILGRIAAATCLARTPFDFDGDGKSDVSVFRPANGGWYISNSSNGSLNSAIFGIDTDLIAPADFDGDGKTDVAVFRNGTWYYLQSSDGAFKAVGFGQAGDLPRPADFDGDGKADINVFRPSNGGWYRLNSSNGAFIGAAFGQDGDKPLVADFDGDGKSDIAVFRPSAGTFYWLESSTGQFKATPFGISEDIPSVGNFDGDAKTDVAVFRPSNGGWYRYNSSNGAFVAQQFGVSGDIPAAADFDGDGKSDIAVFRPSNGAWYILQSSNGGFTGQVFGASGDKPVPSAF